MFRKVLTAALVLSQAVVPAAYAADQQQFYFRYKHPVLEGEQPENEDVLFAAFNVYGTYENLNAWGDEPGLEIALRDINAGGKAYRNGATWQLVSGSLPPGVAAKVNAGTDTLSFEGHPTVEGVYPDIVYRIRDKDGDEVTSKPVTFEVGPRAPFWLYAWPGETRSILAKTEDANLRVSAANLALGLPVAEDGWKVEGELPPGIGYGVDERGLTFTGTADVAGVYSGIKVIGTDLSGASASLGVSFKVEAPITTANSISEERLYAKTDAASLVTTLRSVEDGAIYTGGASWILKSGQIPPGITATPSADGSVMSYSGYATQEGTFDDIVWTVTDTQGNSVITAPVRFVIEPRQPLTLAAAPTANPYLIQDESLDLVISASHLAFERPLDADSFELGGTLPDGIVGSFADGTLHLTGSTSATGVYNDIVVTATDAGGDTDSIDITLTVNTDLVALNVGDRRQELAQGTSQASGGIVAQHAATGDEFTEGLTWTLVSGTLPPGISAQLNAANSRLSFAGYPSEQGEWNNLVWEILDAGGNKVRTRPVSFVVGPGEAFTLAASGNTHINAYTVTGLETPGKEFRVSASNLPGGLPIRNDAWVVSGTLPDGVTYQPTSEAIIFSGLPKKVGFYPVVVSATAGSGETASLNLGFDVANGLVSPGEAGAQDLKQYTEAANLRHDITVRSTGQVYTGGGLTWELSSGRLPPDITAVPAADGSGLKYSGYATETGNWNNIIYRVTDSNGNTLLTQRRSFHVSERDPFTLEANAQRRYMQVNEPSVEVAVTATNPSSHEAIDPSTWSVAGDLPPGIGYAVNGDVMTFSGRPTIIGEFNNIVVSAKDRSGAKASVTLSFVVREQPPSDIDAETSPSHQVLTQFTDQATMKTRLYMGFWHSPITDGQFTVNLVSGTLPPGITAAKQPWGIEYSGYPIELGTWDNIVWELTDWQGRKLTTSPAAFTVVQRSPLALTADKANPRTIRTISDDADLTVTPTNLANGVAIEPSAWVVTGNVPAGITYSAVNGRLKFSGIPKYMGTYDIKVQATDSKGGKASLDVRFQVTSGLGSLNLGVHTGTMSAFTTESETSTLVKVLASNATYTAPITWTHVSGAVPLGITTEFTSNSRIVYKGYPVQEGTFDNIVWKGTDANGNTFLTKPVSFKVGPRQAIALSSDRGVTPAFDTVNRSGVVVTAANTAYDAGIGAANWSLSGTLPDGLVFTPTAGGAVIEGLAKHVGTYPVTIKAVDNAGTSAEILLTLNVVNGLEIKQYGGTSVNLYQWTENFSGSSTVVSAATGTTYANAASTWVMVSGTLPAGITASVSADKSRVTYSGIAKEAGTFNIVWRMTDANGNSVDSKPLTLNVIARDPMSLARGGTEDVRTITGMPYDPRYVRVTAANFASGGIASADWTVTGLPDGLSYSVAGSYYLNITGIPKKTGSYPIKVTAKDGVGQQAEIEFTLVVVNGLSAAHYNSVAETITQSGGAPITSLIALETAANAPYRNGNLVWQQVSGTLPPGITLLPATDGSSMQFGGSATAAGTFANIVFRVTDANGNTFLTAPFTFTVNGEAPLQLSATKTSISALVGTSVSSVISASNLRSGDTLSASNWSVTGLPAGVTYSTSGTTLTVSGSPTASGTSLVHVVLTDGFGRSKSIDVTLTITAGGKIVFGTLEAATGSTFSMSRYQTAADVYVRIVDAETNQDYQGSATWEQLFTQLPAGMTAQWNGTGTVLHITGIPTELTSGWKYLNWNVTLSDGKVLPAQVGFLISEKPALSFVGNGNLSTYGGYPFSKNITVKNTAYGLPVASNGWTVTGLPAGVTWRADDSGLWIEGTPGTAAVGAATVQFTAKDSLGYQASGSFTLTVNSPIGVLNNTSSYSFTALTQNVDQTIALAQDKKNGGYMTTSPTWTLVSGQMPPGLSFAPASNNPGWLNLVGYPTQAGTYLVQVKATDANGFNATGSSAMTVTVGARAALSWGTNTIAATMKVGTAISSGTFKPANVAYKNVTNWTVTGLPPGLSYAISDVSGITKGQLTVTGTPTTAGSYSAVFTATEQGGGTISVTKNITVNP